jgi:chromosome partitioning protein
VSIITLATSKGGAGKTTLAQIIVGTVHELGYSVGVIDGDVNGTMSAWLTRSANLDVECLRVRDESQIVPTAHALRARHDLVVIDTAGGPSQATLFAIGCSDLVLIPLQLSNGDVVEAAKTYNVVQSACEMVERDIPGRLVFTDYTPKTNIAKHVRKQTKKRELPTMRTRLHHLVAFKELTFSGKVPKKGTAAAQGQLLVDEIVAMGCLSLGSQMKKAS